jgi:hypothetical protein
MKPIGIAVFLALVVVGVVIGGTVSLKGAAPASRALAGKSAQPMPPPPPFPNVVIPGIPPAGDCCLWQLEKRIDGQRQANFGNPYKCDTGATARGDLKIVVKLKTAGPVCDQSNIIPDGSVLMAEGPIIRRNDLFADFMGEFTINSPAGAVLFKGTIETLDRVGSHQLFFNCEACNPKSHFEGYLVGQGVQLSNYSLRALIVARGTVPAPGATGAVAGSIDGTLMKCP